MLKTLIKNTLLHIFPTLIKRRVFKSYEHLSLQNISNSKHDGELVLLKYFLKPESIFFDIGANSGTYAYFAEKYVQAKNIYLFEPEKQLYFQLKHIFKSVNVHNLALSNHAGVQKFKIPFINGVMDKSLSTLEIDAKEVNETKNLVYEVRTSTLDSFTEWHRALPDLIKIDVEGHEQSVLDGGRNYISTKFPMLIIEIEQRHHPNLSIEKVFNDITILNYHCFYFSKKAMQIIDYGEKKYLMNDIQYFGTKDYINNYIFIHQSDKRLHEIEKINLELTKSIE
jgi:FkbM family methyltransferase